MSGHSSRGLPGVSGASIAWVAAGVGPHEGRDLATRLRADQLQLAAHHADPGRGGLHRRWWRPAAIDQRSPQHTHSDVLSTHIVEHAAADCRSQQAIAIGIFHGDRSCETPPPGSPFTGESARETHG